MKLGKIINGTATLTDVEEGRELNEPFRSEEELYAAGWKKACLTPKPCADAKEQWREYPTCLVQEWNVPAPELSSVEAQ